MRSKLAGLAPRMTLAGVAVALVTALVFTSLLLSIQSQRDAATAGRDARRAINNATQVKIDVLNIETGLRGFALVRRPNFLQPLNAAKNRLPSDVQTFRTEARDDGGSAPAQAEQIARNAISYWSDYVAPAVAQIQRGGHLTPSDLLGGKARVDQLHNGIDSFSAAENAVLTKRRNSSNDATNRATAIAAVGFVLLMALLLVGLIFLLRGVVRPVGIVADAAGIIAGGDLAARVPPRRGSGEVYLLGSSFNAMAASLQESHDRTARQTAELEAQRAELVAAVERLGSEKARVERYLRFGRRIAVESEVDVAAQTILGELAELAGGRAGALYVIEGDRDDTPRLAATIGDIEPPKTVEASSPMARALEAGYLVRGTRPVLGPDGTDELHVPLRTGHLNVGVVVLADPDAGRFPPEAVETAADLAVQAAVTLAKALLLRSVRESATLVRAVLDATPDAIAVTDPTGATILENPPMRAVRAALVESARAPGGGFRTDFHVDLSDPDTEVRDELELFGTRRVFARYVGPVRSGSGVLVGRLVVLREITAEREADRVKDEFFALVSHELRTPLTAIIGYVELVLDDDEDTLDDTHRTHLEIADRNAKRLLRLVGDLLFVAQVETGQLSLEMSSVDLAEVAARSIETFLARARQRQIPLGADVTRVPALRGDRDRLGQALDNLIANALKFTPRGGEVEVRLRREGGEAVLSVCDSGPGIPADEQEHLFERFFRAEQAVQGAVEGIGLGLAIAQAIVHGHGGRIVIDSTPGKGATFSIRLPLAAERGEREPAQAAASGEGAGGR